MTELYEEAYREFLDGDTLFAAKKFNEAEILFPQSIWAPKSALMSAYSYYIQDYYGDAVAELKRFTKVYPKHRNIDYAYYLLALCYYDQIVDEKKDLEKIVEDKGSEKDMQELANKELEELIKKNQENEKKIKLFYNSLILKETNLHFF